MIALQNKHTHAVVCLARTDEPQLDDDVFVDGESLIFGVSNKYHHLITCDSVPENFVPNAFAYENGIWSVLDQSAVDAAVSMSAEAEAEKAASIKARKAKELQGSIVAATQQRLDNFAQTRNYDGILSACTYATSAVPKFATEGQYAVQARDATWAALYQFMADVQAGTQPAPAGFEDVEPNLPTLEWPQ